MLVALHAFCLQTGLPMTGLAVAGAQWRLKPEDRRVLQVSTLSIAQSHAVRGRSVTWESYGVTIGG